MESDGSETAAAGGVPWVGLGIAALVVGVTALGLRWMQQHQVGVKEAQELLAKAFVEGAQAVDPARRAGFYGGWTDAYYWDQKKEELEMLVWVPEGTRGSQIRVDVTSTTIDVTVKGEVIVSGDLEREVKSSETVWFLESEPDRLVKPPPKHAAVNITLQKKVSTDPMTHWPELVAGGGSKKQL